MVQAQLLVTAPSCFSYTPALFAQGLVLFTPSKSAEDRLHTLPLRFSV
jgi:hypothetical protein